MDLTNNPLYKLNYSLIEKCVATDHSGSFVDIGANNGGMIIFAHPDQPVVAFEPVQDMFYKMVERWSNRPNCQFNNYGLSDKPGKLSGVSVFNAWTLARPGQYNFCRALGYENQTFDVELSTLDIYMEKFPQKVSTIKLDVDGYDYRVLHGGIKTIQRDRPPIYFELSHLPIKLGDDAETEVKFILNEMGYVFASNDGAFWTDSCAVVLENYPYDTTFDVVLIPKEKVEILLPAL